MKYSKQNIIAACWALVLLLGYGQLAADSLANGLLFKVQSAAVAPSYLAGTMHSSDPRVLEVMHGFSPSMKASQRLVMEMVPDATSMLAASAGMFYMDGRSLRDVTGEPLYSRVATVAGSKGINEPLLNRLKPWAAAAALSLPASQDDVMDVALYKMFLDDRKPVFGLETASEQLAVFEGLTDELQVTMLRETVDQFEQIPEMFEKMLQTYIAGDLNGLMELSVEQQTGTDVALTEWFEQKLLIERNHRMVKALDEHLQKGGAFINIGALHLVGDQGIINLLRHQGYRVSVVR